MKEINIYLLRGLCELEFGQSIHRAQAVFGDPDEKEDLFDELLNEKSIVLHYWDQGFSLFFRDNELKTFSCAEVDRRSARLFGQVLFELKEDELIRLFKENGFKISESEEHTWGEKRLSFDDAFADLYFENGKLVSINFCVPDLPAETKYNLN